MWNPLVYVAKAQYVENETTCPALYTRDVNQLPQPMVTLLFYARAVDPTLIMPINVLASEQSKATSYTADKLIKLLNYCSTHPEIKIRYHAYDMILYIHSDASSLSERESKSRAGGLLYIGISADTSNKLTNGEIIIISTVIKHMMSLEAEA
jgi:hypothetical protein